MDSQELDTLIKEAQKATDTADAVTMFSIKMQFKYFVTMAIVCIVFALALVGVVAIHAWQESQIYTEIQYEAVGSMGDGNNVVTGEGSLTEHNQTADTITNNEPQE